MINFSDSFKKVGKSSKSKVEMRHEYPTHTLMQENFSIQEREFILSSPIKKQRGTSNLSTSPQSKSFIQELPENENEKSDPGTDLNEHNQLGDFLGDTILEEYENEQEKSNHAIECLIN